MKGLTSLDPTIGSRWGPGGTIHSGPGDTGVGILMNVTMRGFHGNGGQRSIGRFHFVSKTVVDWTDFLQTWWEAFQGGLLVLGKPQK